MIKRVKLNLKVLIFVVLPFFNIVNAKAIPQTHKLDSLYNKALLLPDDTLKVLELNELCFQYIENQLDTAFLLGRQALNLSGKLAYDYGKAKSLFNLGLVLRYQSKYDLAIEYSNKSYEIFKKLNKTAEKARVLNSLGNIYLNTGNYEESLNNFFESLNIYEQNGDFEKISYVLNNLGGLYRNLGENEKALDFYMQSLELKRELDLKDKIPIALMNVGIMYKVQGNHIKALQYFKEALNLMDEKSSKYDKLLLINHMGTLYESISSYSIAKQYYEESIKLSNEIGDKEILVHSFQGLGNIYIWQGRYREGLISLVKSYSLAKELNNISAISSISQSLSKIYEYSKDYKHGLYYFKIFQGLNDSLLGIEKTKQIKEIEIRYETEKKQQQIELQETKLAQQELKIKQQRTVRNSLFGGMAAFFIISVLAAYAYYMKKKANQKIAFQMEEIETQSEHLSESNKILQQQALSAQMNPHFIFNTLNSIQYFIYENNKEESNKYISKFSKLMRIVLDNSQQQLILIEKELEALELYLELESLRFGNKFTYTINCEEEALEYKVPALLIQPFAENAIVHGLANKKEGEGQLNITIKLETDYIVCTIEDNGIGRLAAIKLRKGKDLNHKSLGTKITEKRLDIANSLYGEKMNVKYTDKIGEDCKALGTKVEITLPLMH